MKPLRIDTSVALDSYAVQWASKTMQVKVAERTIRMVQAYFGLDCHVSIEIEDMVEDDNAYCTQYESGDYGIEVSHHFLKTASEQEIVQVIAHEMVHVKQHEHDELKMGTRGSFYKGQFFDSEVEGYWFLPWEIEARGYEMAFWALYTETWEQW